MGEDFFDDIDDILEEMERELEEMLSSFRKENRELFKRPFVRGFTFEIENGRPKFRTFGDLGPRGDTREPIVEQVVSNGQLNVIIEMPGVEKEAINLQAGEDSLAIDARSEDRVYKTSIPLKEPVDPDSAKATYKNGILEVRFRLRSNNNKAYKRLNIE